MQILGTEYDLIEDDKLVESQADGECLEYAKQIRIRPVESMLTEQDGLSDKKKRYDAVLRHEIVHAFFIECALDEYCYNEQLVDWIAVQFPKMLEVFEQLECTGKGGD